MVVVFSHILLPPSPLIFVAATIEALLKPATADGWPAFVSAA